MKQLLAAQSITVVADRVAPTDPKLAKLIGSSPLGLVAQRFFETYIVVLGHTDDVRIKAEADEKPPQEATFRQSWCIEMTAANYETAKQSVADLVELRNELAHHFLERFDMHSQSGCLAAASYLSAACERIGRDYEELRRWARSMAEAQQSFAVLLTSDAFLDLIVSESSAGDGAN